MRSARVHPWFYFLKGVQRSLAGRTSTRMRTAAARRASPATGAIAARAERAAAPAMRCSSCRPPSAPACVRADLLGLHAASTCIPAACNSPDVCQTGGICKNTTAFPARPVPTHASLLRVLGWHAAIWAWCHRTLTLTLGTVSQIRFPLQLLIAPACISAACA